MSSTWGMTLDPAEDWRTYAACAKYDGDLWFPAGKGPLTDYQYQQARLICLSCPVLRDCERWARRARPEFGMLAGLTPEQRRIRHGAPITAAYGGQRVTAGAR